MENSAHEPNPPHEKSPVTPPARRLSKRNLKFDDKSPVQIPPAATRRGSHRESPTWKPLTTTNSKSMASLGGSSIHTSATSTGGANNKRMYRASGDSSRRNVTREIAALEFLQGIPLAAEAKLVQAGWRLQQKQYEEEKQDHDLSESEYPSGSLVTLGTTSQPNGSKLLGATAHGTWWEKHVRSSSELSDSMSLLKTKKEQEGELERPPSNTGTITQATRTASGILLPAYTPGRRLDGDDAIRIQIPLTTTGTKTRQKSIARQAAIREWERNTAHGAQLHPPLLDGRLFFSASGSYPISVFSMIRYEPRREQAERSRKKIESLGGGGSQFVMPSRDWRGISYRALLPRKRTQRTLAGFNRFLRDDGDNAAADKQIADTDNDSVSSDSSSSEDSDVYVPGLLDDPDMAHGRHHNVMIGDHITGPIVASTIQFVKPAILKAELNKQFRDRFDGWEPPKEARKYIGAYVSVPEGKYVLKDPTLVEDTAETHHRTATRTRQESVNSLSSVGDNVARQETIRIPPSLTLSKIRSLKQQALQAAIKARLEIGTVALACVYFERLCLDCRVDKSNRRLAFASCLLLASKINEPNVQLVMQQQNEDDEKSRFQAFVRPNKRSTKAFESLLEFFTENWSLSIKTLFDAEWGVFAALGFSLHATPSQVAFHFRRLMKTLEWNPRDYLGKEMWDQWQESLKEEERRKRDRERRREMERKKKEEKLLDLQLELENEMLRREAENDAQKTEEEALADDSMKQRSVKGPARDGTKKQVGIKLFNRFATRRSHSVERTKVDRPGVVSEHGLDHRRKQGKPLTGFPSMPTLNDHDGPTSSELGTNTDTQEGVKSEDTSLVVTGEGSEVDGLIV